MSIFDKYNDLIMSYLKRNQDLSEAKFIQFIHNQLE